MAKANRQAVIDEIIKLIKKNTPRAVILAKICENLRIKSRTFDNYWKDANNQYKKLQEIAKEAANKAYVDGKVEAARDCLMTEKEAQELTTAIARGNLADYMIVKTVEHTPRIQITLKEFIQRKKDEVAFEDEYAASVGLKGAALKLHKQYKAGYAGMVSHFDKV